MCEISKDNVSIVNEVKISCYSCGTTETLPNSTPEQLIEKVKANGWKASRTGLAYCKNCPIVLRYPWKVNTALTAGVGIENALNGDVRIIGKPVYRRPGTRRSSVNYYDKARAKAQELNEAWRLKNPGAPIPEGID